MIVGVLTVDLMVYDARSLKDKRRVVKSVIQRIRDGFSAAVSEVEYHDMHNRCKLGIAIVSNDARVIHSALDRIVDAVRADRRVSLLEYNRTLL